MAEWYKVDSFDSSFNSNAPLELKEIKWTWITPNIWKHKYDSIWTHLTDTTFSFIVTFTPLLFPFIIMLVTFSLVANIFRR